MGWFGRGDGLEKLRSEMRDGMGLCGEFRRFICIFGYSVSGVCCHYVFQDSGLV